MQTFYYDSFVGTFDITPYDARPLACLSHFVLEKLIDPYSCDSIFEIKPLFSHRGDGVKEDKDTSNV